ncbi:hypothetical protein [Streptomyces mexicanus]|jgi:hypothetical protein|uniref:hypothetical protein n=1 Tax=Streptomyces mexicanus TaxID=178566 RepID=UPI0036738D42
MSEPAEGREARRRREPGAPGAQAGPGHPRERSVAPPRARDDAPRPEEGDTTRPREQDDPQAREPGTARADASPPGDDDTDTRSHDAPDPQPQGDAHPLPPGDAGSPQPDGRGGARSPGKARPDDKGGTPSQGGPHLRSRSQARLRGDAPPHDETPSHAGNHDVNHGPDDQGLDGLGPDELALRRLLHEAVQDVAPREDALEHLRRAVPARRARKRQAVVGMAAAALFLGTAVPALVHVSDVAGADANPAMAGQASQAHGGTGQGKGPDGGESAVGGSSATATDPGRNDKKDGHRSGSSTAPGGVGPGAGKNGPSASADTGVPECTGAQLGSATATVGAPDTTGAVYGTFHIANVSSTTCTVSGPGTVTTHAQGAADATRISVVPHTSGDAASGLPDPAGEVSGLVLAPGSAYEVKFAWVPSETCPTTGGGDSSGGGGGGGGTETSGPSPDPSPSQDAGETAGAAPGTDTGATPQLMTEGGTADGSVEISHTTEAGAPTVSATVPNACAGTVYRTGVLPVS